MEILIIIPKYKPTNKKVYSYTFPFGLAYISSVLKKANYNVDCLNLNHYNGSAKELTLNKLEENKYDIICTGGVIMWYERLNEIIKLARNHKSKPIIIIGGPIVTSDTDFIIKSLKPDFGVIGEGEETILELIRCIEKKGDYRKVNGIAYLLNSILKITQPRKLIENLDSIPYPDFEGFEYEKMLENTHTNEIYDSIIDNPRFYPMITSRGCPYQCTFCYHSLGYKYRTRSIDSIITELRKNIKKYKINVIWFFDDLFSINKKRLSDFCKEIKILLAEIDWECKWGCQLSVKDVDKEMLREMKESGCYYVSYGFESMSSDVLKSMKKPITPEQIKNAYSLSIKEKLGVQANLIFGDINETKETAEETLSNWKKYFPGQISLHLIEPYPNSEVFQYCIRNEIIKDKLDYIKKIKYIGLYNFSKMSNKEYNELKRKLFVSYIKYSKYAPVMKMIKINDNIYDLSVKCPYCKEEIKYKNMKINNSFYFGEYVACKDCLMRFFISSRLKIIANKIYTHIGPIQKIIEVYNQTKDNIAINNILTKKET